MSNKHGLSARVELHCMFYKLPHAVKVPILQWCWEQSWQKSLILQETRAFEHNWCVHCHKSEVSQYQRGRQAKHRKCSHFSWQVLPSWSQSHHFHPIGSQSEVIWCPKQVLTLCVASSKKLVNDWLIGCTEAGQVWVDRVYATKATKVIRAYLNSILVGIAAVCEPHSTGCKKQSLH